MSRSPYVQARIAQARHKKDQQIRQASLIGFRRGVVAAAKCIDAMLNDPLAKVYNLQSLIMWKMKVLPREDRMLRDANSMISFEEVIQHAKVALGEHSSEEEFIKTAVAHARSESEVWKLHFQLTGIHRIDLPELRRSKIETALLLRFPDEPSGNDSP